MTDVAGPPVLPLRFSSLPIRGADAATAAGANGSDLEVNCNMAQAFEIPTGNRTATGPCSPVGAHLFPGTPSRSPLPAGPTPSAGSIQQYGSALGSPQARNNGLCDQRRARLPVRRPARG